MQTGSPAVSSLSHDFAEPTVQNFGLDAALTMDVGSFDATAQASGFTEIFATYNRGATASASGTFSDCATAGGYSGAGVLHIPIHLTGSRTLSYSASGTYVPPESKPPSFAQLRIRCAAATVGSGLSTPCDDPSFLWIDSGEIDNTVELVFGFTFGQPVLFQFGPQLLATTGYAANGDTGSLTGSTDVHLAGTLLPAYITDPGGSPLAGATLRADSGFDYLTAPEPGGAWAAAAIALALLRRTRQSFAMIRSA